MFGKSYIEKTCIRLVVGLTPPLRSGYKFGLAKSKIWSLTYRTAGDLTLTNNQTPVPDCSGTGVW